MDDFLLQSHDAIPRDAIPRDSGSSGIKEIREG